MTIHHQDPRVTVHHGDCLDVLRSLPGSSVDSIVTDPPYGLGFMGKAWDDLPPGLPWAQECLRVLKPGGHLLAFGGTRTWHRLAVAVEDAGFEVRDSIAWLYGSGFPKSLDVSKAIDKAGHLSRPRALEFTEWMRSTGISASAINEATGTNMGSHYLTDKTQPAVAVADLFDRLRPLLPEVPERIERLVAERTGLSWADYQARPVTQEEREKLRSGEVISFDQRSSADRGRRDIPATPAAQQWQGWGTALKPAFEPIVVARKPLVGTVAANVLAHGTGALNVDGCRVGRQEGDRTEYGRGQTLPHANTTASLGKFAEVTPYTPDAGGRWPANVLLDGSQAEALDEQSGHLKAPRSNGSKTPEGMNGTDTFRIHAREQKPGRADDGGASRFFPVFPQEFDCCSATVDNAEGSTCAPSSDPDLPTFRYQAKAPTRERPTVAAEDGTKTAHPTVKPLALMRWLVRLVTPPGGTVLDTFAGSGTTVEAALLEGFSCVAIEREADYLPLIDARILRGAAEVAAPAVARVVARRSGAQPDAQLDLLGDAP